MFGAKKAEAFWERLPDDQPSFMRAIAREAVDDWNGLFLYASQWIKDDAGNPEPWVALGKSLYRLNRYSDAIAPLKKAIEFESSHSQGWFYLARTYRDMGDKNSLAAALEKLSALDPVAAQSLRADSPQ